MYVYVVCDIDLIASRYDYHLIKFLYGEIGPEGVVEEGGLDGADLLLNSPHFDGFPGLAEQILCQMGEPHDVVQMNMGQQDVFDLTLSFDADRRCNRPRIDQQPLVQDIRRQIVARNLATGAAQYTKPHQMSNILDSISFRPV